MGLFSVTNVAISLVALLVTHRIYWELTTGVRHRSLARQHGALPPKSLNTRWSNCIFGLDLLLRNIGAFKEHRLLQAWTDLLRDHNAHTVSMNLMGQKLFITDDPDNTKAVLATDFDAWSLGQERIKQLSDILGHGIFSTEGAAWKVSRNMLRPCFERSQVADVSMLEKHTSRFINILPRDGTTVDLQPLFYDLSLDISSEFLFDQSTDALLDQRREDMATREFMESLEYCTNPMENENVKKYGFVGSYLPNRKFKICVAKIQGMYS
jgi:cytochrome P450